MLNQLNILCNIISKIINLYINLLNTHMYHFFLVFIDNLQCIHCLLQLNRAKQQGCPKCGGTSELKKKFWLVSAWVFKFCQGFHCENCYHGQCGWMNGCEAIFRIAYGNKKEIGGWVGTEVGLRDCLAQSKKLRI